MQKFADFQQGAKDLPRRLKALHEQQQGFLNVIVSCFPQGLSENSFKQATLISKVADSMHHCDATSLFSYLKDDTENQISDQNQLHDFKYTALIGMYLKTIAVTRESVFNQSNRLLTELLVRDLGIKSLDEIDDQQIQACLSCLSQYCSFVFKNRKISLFADLDTLLGLTIQLDIENAKTAICANKGGSFHYSPWTWLEGYTKDSSLRNLDLFKAAMEHQDFYKIITSSPENQARFLSTMESYTLNIKDILELIPQMTDGRVKTLLIIHVLSREDFYTQLKGESILTRLHSKHLPIPSRLNPLIHQMDPVVFTPDFLAKLQPEAAVSLLFSIPHFHTWTSQQVRVLLEKYKRVELIDYWLRHFHSMPNSQYVLSCFAQLIDRKLAEEIENLEPLKRNLITHRIVQHLRLFNPKSATMVPAFTEANLDLAIRYYLNGHVDARYVAFINNATNYLMNQHHSFSLHTIQLLNSLLGMQAFSEINAKASYLIHFLKHYKGGDGDLTVVLYDTLAVFARKKSAGPLPPLVYCLVRLLDDESVQPELNAALFSAFLFCPQLFDDDIKKALFEYDAKGLVTYFGMQGGVNNYKQVISLSAWALDNLAKSLSSGTLQMLKQAKFEAECELQLSGSGGYLLRVVHYVTRCFFYGWTGFFVPNRPVYVLQADEIIKVERCKESGSVDFKKSDSMFVLEQRMLNLISSMNKQYSANQLKELTEILVFYGYKKPSTDEFRFRKHVDVFYRNLLQTQKGDPVLLDSDEVFLDNKSRILELMLVQSSFNQVKEELALSVGTNTSLEQLQSEFKQPALELIQDEVSQHDSPLQAKAKPPSASLKKSENQGFFSAMKTLLTQSDPLSTEFTI